MGKRFAGVFLVVGLGVTLFWRDDTAPASAVTAHRDGGEDANRAERANDGAVPATITWPPAARVVGPRACVACHAEEYEMWSRTKHSRGLESLRSSPDARQYAERLGVHVTDLIGDSLCTDCHGLRGQDREGRLRVVSGVACESCHGAAGGSDGWLNSHSSFGHPGATRESESPEHRRTRLAKSEQAGMNRPARLYRHVRNCFHCHVVWHEELVNVAGHPTGSDFELVAWLLGEVRHNLLLDPSENGESASLLASQQGVTAATHKRVLYVLGNMLDMELSLRALAHGRQHGTFARALAGRVRAAAGALEDVNDRVNLEEVAATLSEYERVRRKLQPGGGDMLTHAADRVAEHAQRFAARHDGSQLAALDELLPTTYRGTTYAP